MGTTTIKKVLNDSNEPSEISLASSNNKNDISFPIKSSTSKTEPETYPYNYQTLDNNIKKNTMNFDDASSIFRKKSYNKDVNNQKKKNNNNLSNYLLHDEEERQKTDAKAINSFEKSSTSNIIVTSVQSNKISQDYNDHDVN